MPQTKLNFRSLFLHAWDLAEDGVDAVMGEMADAGLNVMCFAGTHSGWFIHPHAQMRRTFMTEGSVCYFRPQASLYKTTRLKPVVSTICRKRDWLAEAGKRLDRHSLRLVSWTIGTHNTRLGLAHPQLTQRNVYGDRIPHALCPANDDVRAYLIAICRDLATNYPMWALQLESFGWMNIAHGHHHERDLVGLSPLEHDLLSLCVCDTCTRRAMKAGVDVAATIATARAVLDDAFRNAPDRPKRHPRTMPQLERRSPDLRSFNAWRKRYGDAFICELKTEALRGTSCRLLMQSGYEPALAGGGGDTGVDGFACGAYGLAPGEVARACRAALRPVPSEWDGLFQCFVRLGNGVPRSHDQLRAIVRAVADAGCNGINFYNRSEAPPRMLSWLRAALRGTI